MPISAPLPPDALASSAEDELTRRFQQIFQRPPTPTELHWYQAGHARLQLRLPPRGRGRRALIRPVRPQAPTGLT